MLRILFLFIIASVVAYFSLFRVQQYEQAIVFQFKEIQRSDHEPGLHFMIPIINTAQKFETRLLNLDQGGETTAVFNLGKKGRDRRLLREMDYL